jgi:hypothetical protein
MTMKRNEPVRARRPEVLLVAQLCTIFHVFFLPAHAGAQEVMVLATKPPTVAAPVAPPLPADEPVAEPAEAPFSPGWVSLGLSCLLGTRPTEQGIEPTWLPGIDLGFRVDPQVALGLRRVHVTGTERALVLGLSPYLEVSARPWERLDLYGQTGVQLDVLVPYAGSDALGSIAPFVGVGARFYAAEIFSIALDGVAHLPVSGGLAAGTALLPVGSIHVSSGLALAFHWS